MSAIIEVGVVKSMNQVWTSVTLNTSFTTPVIVCTASYGLGDLPMVVRIKNVSSKAFKVKLQIPDKTDAEKGIASKHDVHYMVVEQGSHVIGDIKLEASRITSTDTWGTEGGQNIQRIKWRNTHTVKHTLIQWCLAK